MNEIYYLALADHPDSKREVSKEEWVRAERAAGFRPKGEDRGQCATGGFGNGSVRGTIEHSDPAPPVKPADHFEYPESPGDCYVDKGDDLDAPLLLNADAAANYIASIISDFTGDEVDGDGDPWSIVCEHLSGLLDNLRNVILIPEHDQIRDLLDAEYGLTIRPPRPPTIREEP